MKAMKKTVSIVLTLCLVLSMLAVAAVSVSAEGEEQQTTTITFGVVSYVQDELSSTDWKVFYDYRNADAGDAGNVSASYLNKTVQKRIAHSWNEPQTYSVYSAEIPADATYFQVHNGNRWFGGYNGGAAPTETAFVYNYGDGDQAYYQDNRLPLESGHYLAGVDAFWNANVNYPLIQNPDNTAEYMILNTKFGADTEIKAVYYDAAYDYTTWLTNNNYKFNVTGYYDVYAKPDNTIYAGDSSLKAKTLSIGGGDIAVNFYFANKPDTVTFSWNGMVEHDAEVADVIYDDSKGLYKATCRVAAPEMGDEITAKYSFDNGATAFTTTTSVKDCAEAYINGEYQQDVKNLAQAMLNYGAAAQAQFDHNQNNPVADITDLATLTKDDIKLYVNGAQEDKSSVTPSGAILAKNDKLADYNLQYAGCSLTMKSNTTLRFYFRATSADAVINPNNITLFLLNGESAHLTAAANQDGVYYVEQTDIGACLLGEAKSLRAGQNDDLGEYSALSYVKLALGSEKAKDTLKTTVSALYNYYAAASVWHHNHSVLNA